MYQIRCDDYVLYDHRDDALVVLNPKCKLEANKVGEGSFTILSSHPYYGKLKTLRSIFEIRQDGHPIFRGRMTADSRDFHNQLDVDLEGVLGFTNDSIIPPFDFPKDFPEAANATNMVEYFLKWILDQHNGQVEDWQKLKLGNVTVTDPNNYITRSSDKYLHTWDILKAKLFDSDLGGYLCIRYEDDGNYVDYVSEFELTNTQRITFGENLLDITNESDASETYSAILPIGKDGLTLESLEDGDVTEDLVKKGKFIYSKAAVNQYGWICVPVEESTWNDVTVVSNLRTKAVAHLTNTALVLSNTITVKAVDLHFTDDQIQSFRIHRNILVDSPAHYVSGVSYPLTKLDIDILNPQNTKITIGDTSLTLLDVNDDKIDNAIQRIEGTTNDLKDKVSNVEEKVNKIEGIDGVYFYVKYSQYADGHVMKDAPDDSTIYMGTCSTSETTAPTDYRKYTWCRVRGTDGKDGKDGTNGQPGQAGEDGKSQYFHVKYSNDGKTFTGNLVPTDLTEWVTGNYGDSGFYPTSTWVLSYPEMIPVAPETYGVRTNCSDSQITISLVRYDATGAYLGQVNYLRDNIINFADYTDTAFVRIKLTSKTNSTTRDDYEALWESGDLSPEFFRGVTIGEELGDWMGTCVNDTEADPTEFDAYTWKKIVGEDGQNGIDGADGKDGQSAYFYVKFSANANGNPMTETPQSDTKYMGVCSSTSATAPTDPSAYDWTQCRGNDGANGTPGATGADGKTQYLHIKYSDDGETFTANNGEELGAYIGTLVDFVEADSNNFNDYTWKKFTEDVDEELENIRQTMTEQYTSVLNTADAIIMEALERYVETSNYEEFRQTVTSQLEMMADEISMKFTTTTEQIEDVGGDLQAKFEQLYKYISFSGDTAITIGSGDSAITLEIDNAKGIVFKKNGVSFGRWDGNNFYTGNIVVEVNERAQFGNFAFVPRSDGSLSLLMVGG